MPEQRQYPIPFSTEIAPYHPEVTHHVIEQNENRKHWQENDTDESLEQMMRDEFQEYLEALEKCQLGDDPFSFVSEAGDMGYLYVKRRRSGTPLPIDVVDMMIQVERDLASVGMTMEECITFKNWRNDYKYVSMATNNGYQPDQARSIIKEFWSHLGGDLVFYYAYMMMAEKL